MSSNALTEFSDRLRKLGDSVSELYAAMVNNEVKIRQVDLFTRNQFREQWSSYCEEYQRVVDASDSAAMTLSSLIELYIALQERMNAANVADMINELTTLRKETEESIFDPTVDLIGLKQSLDVLAREINTKVKERDGVILRQLGKTDSDVTLKPSQVIHDKARESGTAEPSRPGRSYINRLVCGLSGWSAKSAQVAEWIRPPAHDTHYARDVRKTFEDGASADRMSESSGRSQPGVSSSTAAKLKLKKAFVTVTQATFDVRERQALELEAVLRAVHDLQGRLLAQVQLFGLFTEVSGKLTEDVDRALGALHNLKIDASPQGQLGFRRALQGLFYGTEAWNTKKLILEEYARQLKCN